MRLFFKYSTQVYLFISIYIFCLGLGKKLENPDNEEVEMICMEVPSEYSLSCNSLFDKNSNNRGNDDNEEEKLKNICVQKNSSFSFENWEVEVLGKFQNIYLDDPNNVCPNHPDSVNGKFQTSSDVCKTLSCRKNEDCENRNSLGIQYLCYDSCVKCSSMIDPKQSEKKCSNDSNVLSSSKGNKNCVNFQTKSGFKNENEKRRGAVISIISLWVLVVIILVIKWEKNRIKTSLQDFKEHLSTIPIFSVCFESEFQELSQMASFAEDGNIGSDDEEEGLPAIVM